MLGHVACWRGGGPEARWINAPQGSGPRVEDEEVAGVEEDANSPGKATRKSAMKAAKDKEIAANTAQVQT